MEKIFDEIRKERKRQDAKWGVQNHDNFVWNTILGEEKGEASYDYLTDMPMKSLSKKRVDQLKKQTDDRIASLEDLKKKSIKNLWLEDLNTIEKLYKKFIKE